MRAVCFRAREGLALVGFPALPWVLVRWLLRPTYVAFVRDLEGDLPDVPVISGTRTTTATARDIPALLAMNPLLAETEVRRRLDDWPHAHLTWVGDTLAHYHWGAQGHAYLPYLDATVTLGEGDYLIAETFTAPSCRRQRLHTAASFACLRRARALGFRRVVGFVAAWNTPSASVARRMGRTAVGTAGHVGLGPLRIPFVTGTVRRLDGPRTGKWAAAARLLRIV